MKKLIILSAILLSSCAMQPKTVYVPVVAKCPAPNLPPERRLPVQELKAGDSPGTVVKAYVSSLAICRHENQILRKKLEVYK